MKYITYNKLLFNNTKKLEYTVDNVYDNFIVVKNTNNMLGTMTLDGTIIMPPSFYAIEPHGDLYKTKNKLKYGLINKFGVEILKPTYTVINEFTNHTAIVCLDNIYYGVINDKLACVVTYNQTYDFSAVLYHIGDPTQDGLYNFINLTAVRSKNSLFKPIPEGV